LNFQRESVCRGEFTHDGGANCDRPRAPLINIPAKPGAVSGRELQRALAISAAFAELDHRDATPDASGCNNGGVAWANRAGFGFLDYRNFGTRSYERDSVFHNSPIFVTSPFSKHLEIQLGFRGQCSTIRRIRALPALFQRFHNSGPAKTGCTTNRR
jgi:hypothetical protein